MSNGGWYEGEWFDGMRDGYGVHVIKFYNYSIGIRVALMKGIGS